MTNLIKRLEEAEEGCPFLDREIWVALEFDGNRSPVDAPEYTTSIDAALALAERLGLDVLAITNEAVEALAVGGWSSSLRTLVPELARHACIAILKATDTGRG